MPKNMVSTAPPRVESLNVYQDQVQIIFSQYMKPATVGLNVFCGGQSVTGILEPANAEYNEEQTEQFATVFNFIPDTELFGSPEPEHLSNPFVDVKESAFYYKAVLWAVENGITAGLDATHFGPTSYCNRAQVVTFLCRAIG